MFIDNYEQLCANIGKSPTAVLKELGMSHNMYAHWRTGGIPTNPTKLKLADYFDISVSELMGAEKKPATAMSNELSNLDIQLIQMLSSLSDVEKRMFLAQMNAVIASREN